MSEHCLEPAHHVIIVVGCEYQIKNGKRTTDQKNWEGKLRDILYNLFDTNVFVKGCCDFTMHCILINEFTK